MNVDIIFIDDEEDVLNLLKLKFRKLSKVENVHLHYFLTSRLFEEYIRSAESDVVVIVSDINMPDNHVFEALDTQKERFNFVLSYLCSAYSEDEFQDMIEKNNIKYFFKKPINIENIREKLLYDLEERGIHLKTAS